MPDETSMPGYRPYRWLSNRELARVVRAQFDNLTPLERELLIRVEHAVRSYPHEIGNAVGEVR